MFTRWTIAHLDYDFTVQNVPGQLNDVPDALSSVSTDVTEKIIPSDPQLAAICRNVPEYNPFHPPAAWDDDVFAHNLNKNAPEKLSRAVR